MFDDRTEHEPDEYDPEAEFRDPDSDSITIPRVGTEDAGSDSRSELETNVSPPAVSTSETNVPAELRRNFWALVLVINAAVLALALAAMFLIFEGAVTYAGYLFVAGLVLTGFAVRRYRNFEFEDDDAPTADDGDVESTGGSLEGAAEESASEAETHGTDASDGSDEQTGNDGPGPDVDAGEK